MDNAGIWLPGPRAALDELRRRARRRIASGDEEGRNLRAVRIRLRDNMGQVLFDGTLEEAAGDVLVPTRWLEATRLN